MQISDFKTFYPKNFTSLETQLSYVAVIKADVY